MLHAWAAGRYITRRMRRARAPKRRRGAAGAFRGQGISANVGIISLINLISLIKPIGADMPRHVPTGWGGALMSLSHII